jgi:peptide/nickel transport system ATP-binding protein
LLAALPDPRSSQILVGIPGRAPLPESRPSGCTFHPRCDYARADCALAEPPQRDVSAGHSSRCWFAEEVHQDDTRVATQIPAAPRVVAQAGLVVSNLLARYGNKPVVHDASFSVSPGECLAVVGESGSGKTTVSRCIVGMHAAYDGTITLAGAVLPKSARNRSKEARRAIQYIFQNPHSALNPRRNIEEILLQWSDVLVGGPMAEQRRLVAGTLEQVGLGSEYLGRYPDELSGGQQQRVAIARALICDPAYLICDEVTSALDVSVQASVVTLLGELARTKGLGMLFITHNLPLVRSIAQQVVVMQSGRVVEVGSTEQIFSLPQEAYTRDLLVNTPSLSSAIAGNLARDDGTLARNGLLV